MKEGYHRFIASIWLLLAAIIFTPTVNAQEFKYNDSWGKQGFQLTQQKTNSVEVNYSIQSFALTKEQINGKTLDVLDLPGTLLPNNEGAPNLPGAGRFLAIPEGAEARVEIISSRTETLYDIDMAPAPRIPWETEAGPLDYSMDESIYEKNAFYPESPVMLSEVTEIRGVDVVTLGITPFQYNPVTRELIIYRDLKVKVEFTGGNGHFGDDRLRSRWWDPIMADMFLNYESLPKMNYNKSFQAKDETGCEYLIITPTDDEFLQWADSIRTFRTNQGIRTEVMTVEEAGGNSVNSLEDFFDDAYYNWDVVPSAVLIMGDYGTDSDNRIISPIYNNYCASDNIWADVTGNDMPDYVFARMTAQTAAQLEVMVTKFLDYERTPPTSVSFYQNPISALGFQTERWFQICSESVAGFWENEQGRSPVRINKTYAGNPSNDPWSTATNTSTVLNVFGPSGLGYIPATPSEVNCTWNGTAQDVVNAINNGAFMLQHRDHGLESGWGEPDFQSSNINSLNNSELVFVWSVNCLTGKFNMPGECFAEKFHRYTYNGQNSGALGLNAASEVSYSFVNDAYVWGAYDNMWPDFLPDYGSTPEERGVLPAFGMAAGKYFLQQSSWPYNSGSKQVTYNLFHHLGDAFNTVYTEVPTELTVSHNPILYAGVTSFEVTANEGALIALTVNGEIIGTGEGTGDPLTINIPGQEPTGQLLITVTLQDYYRYEKHIDILPASGPYIIHHSVELYDGSGNANGIMETSESLMASITVKNVGIEGTENVAVTLSTDDDYVNITDNSELYGTIAAGSTAFMENGFAWEVAGDIPDQHNVHFEVNATNGIDTWISSFILKGHAPFLEIGALTMNDENGNGDGRLDPGEEVELTIETYNTGSYEASNLIGTLVPVSAFITVSDPTFEFNDLGAGMMAEAVYTITVSSEAPIGTPASLYYEVNSGAYSAMEAFPATIGLIVEDWETGDMNQYDWSTGGNANWFITPNSPFEGSYCVQSGNIGDNASTHLQIEYEVFGDDVISFAYKVSSEAGYDFLRFFIDGNQQGAWAGQVGWTIATFDVGEGTHTFKWEFEKDYSVSNGSDCAWVDFIILPAPQVTTAFAGVDDGVCAGDAYQTDGVATHYNQLAWTTAGSGTFDDEQALDAVYTPSEEDIAEGSVILTLTAFSPDEEVSDNMLLTISLAPEADAGEDMQVCSASPFGLTGATVTNAGSVLWNTSGDGSFNDNTLINPVYLPGEDDMAGGTVTLTLKASGGSACDQATDDVVVTLMQAASAFAGSDDLFCSSEGYLLDEAAAENYTSLLWTTSGDGYFDDETTLNPVYTSGSGDASSGGVSLTLMATGSPGCEDAVAVVNLTVIQAPEVSAGVDNAVFPGESYLLSDAAVQFYTEVNWTTSGDGTFDDPSVINATYTPGAGDIESKEVMLTLNATGAELCGTVSDEMMLAVNTGLDEIDAGYEIRIYPNPSNGNFTLELNGTRNETIGIRIYNALGDEVFSKKNIRIRGLYKENIRLDADRGLYLMQIELGDNLLTRKISVR